jgi:hypothetical protein
MNEVRAAGALSILRRYRWLFASAVLLAAAYTAGGFLLVPYAARGLLDRYVTDTLHRRVSVGEIRFNPFTLAAEIHDFTLSEADGTPIVRFAALTVDASAASITNRAWTFNEIRLDRPDIRVDIGPDGVINLFRLIPPDDEPSNGPPALRIGTFAVDGGRVAFTDRSRKTPFATTLTPIRFTLTDFRTEASHDNTYRFAGATVDGEELAWSGTFSVKPLGSRGTFSVDGLKSSTIAAYMGDALPVEIPTGNLSLRGEYTAALDGAFALNVRLPTVEVRDVAVRPRGHGGETPWIRIPAATISDVSLSLAERKVAVGRVMLRRPWTAVRREADGSINLTRLMAAAPGAPAEAAAVHKATATEDAPWSISLNALAIEDAAIDAEDDAVTPALRQHLAPVSLTVEGFSVPSAGPLRIDGHVGIGKGSLSARGEVTPSPLAVDVAVTAEAIEMPPAQPYIAPLAAILLNSGTLSASGKLAYRAQPPKGQPALTFAGNVGVTDFATQDAAGKRDFIKWKSLALKGIDYSMTPDRLIIDRVEAREPYGRVIIGPDKSFNIAQILSAKTPDAPVTGSKTTAAPVKATAMPIRVRDVRIMGGSANFADFSIEPNFAAAIYDLQGSVGGLSSSPGSRATVRLAGKVDRYAPVEISGTVNLLSAQAFTDVAMTFRNIELTTFNPYSGKYAGYNISKGKLTTELHYKVQDRKLDAQHHIILDQLEFGDATGSKDAVPLPVRLAVSLLKDRHGVIDLNLPVNGSLDDPQFRLGPIVWQAVKNLMGKIVTAPFALLGSLFGGGPDISYVDFAPGSADLPAEQGEKLAKLSRALAERPQLRLDIPLRTVSASDDAALASAAFDAALAPYLAGRKDTPEDRRRALADLYKAQFGKSPDYPDTPDGEDKTAVRIAFLESALKPRFTATPTAREALGRTRAEAVQAAVLSGADVSPERVFLSDSAPDKPVAAPRLELRLQ